MSIIEVDKNYTSNGREVRILCVDRASSDDKTVVGLYNNGLIRTFKSDGSFPGLAKFNLIEEPTPDEGDWCWFWNKDYSVDILMSKFVKMNGRKFQSANGYNWTECVKFDNCLPDHLIGL
jgi:hypothetical protein